MDPQTFSNLKTQLKQPFFSNKKAALESFLSNYWFSGDQAAEVIEEFPHSSEKDEVLLLIEPRLTLLSGTEAKKIVKAFTFEDGKLKAVELVARHISDPNPTGKYAVLDAIDFHFDKEKARKILDKTRPAQAYGTQCPPGQPQRYSTQPYSQPPPQQPYQPPPQAVPYQPQPGAPYSQPPTQYPYPAPPTQSQPFPPPQGIPYSQAPGFSNQSPYGAPPQPMAAPYVPPTQPPYGVLPAGVPPGYPPPGGYPQQGSYPPPGGHPPTGYPNAYGYPPQ